ncbi:MAG: hypothetical protein ABIJ75_10570 [Actinomycetota bacterium]
MGTLKKMILLWGSMTSTVTVTDPLADLREMLAVPDRVVVVDNELGTMAYRVDVFLVPIEEQ